MNISGKFNWLPVAQIAAKVCEALNDCSRLVVTAPPGAGKSTLLPLALLETIPSGKILVLEPRRIAARSVANRMAEMVGEKAGQTVGYRIRFETKVSASTRIEVITEGILERLLVDDPTLDGIQAIVFDEYHERSLSSDLSLALALQAQALVRPDLKLLIMSATIDPLEICQAMKARHLDCPGRLFPLEEVWCGDFEPRTIAEAAARTVARAWREQPGDILIFLPGQAEILKCARLLEGKFDKTDISVLYGALPPHRQQVVFSPVSPGRRRIVVSSPVAETSLTIPGITAVVDSGLCRMPVFDPVTGLTRLSTSRISLDMATQRAGRAARLGKGTVYKLWSKAVQSRMAQTRQPEILSADLTPTVLTTAAWGENDPLQLPWITPPPRGHVDTASGVLRQLGALDDLRRITREGKRMSGLPSHPRISRMLLEAGVDLSLGADIAALLEEKDPLGDMQDADLSTRIGLLRQYRKGGRLSGRWTRVNDIAMQYLKLMNARPDTAAVDSYAVGRLVAKAFPERIAMRQDNGTYRLAAGGSAASLDSADDLNAEPFLAVAAMSSRIFLAAPLRREDAAEAGHWVTNAVWQTRPGRVLVREELRIGALTIASRPAKGDTGAVVLDVIAVAAPKEGLSMFDFNNDVRRLQRRIELVSSWHPDLELPDVSAAALLQSARRWLPGFIGKATTAQELLRIDMSNVILSLLSYRQQQELERIAPASIKLPGGRNAKIDYREGSDTPVVSARLQDCFGLVESPTVDNGRRPVLMELLSPGFKPVQLTQDLKGFWKSTYFEVRKELRRRYPKHRWPDDPLNPA